MTMRELTLLVLTHADAVQLVAPAGTGLSQSGESFSVMVPVVDFRVILAA